MNDFAWALASMKNGQYLRRDSWPGITYVFLAGEVFMRSNLGVDKPWAVSHLDLLAEDWQTTIPDR